MYVKFIRQQLTSLKVITSSPLKLSQNLRGRNLLRANFLNPLEWPNGSGTPKQARSAQNSRSKAKPSASDN